MTLYVRCCCSVYPKMYHEIFLDPERDVVITDVLNWMKQRADN